MRHHTKDKGDIGVSTVIADLVEHGIKVSLPMCEHLPFDCIAIAGEECSLFRLSVKYRQAVRGSIEIRLRSSWVSRTGNKTKRQNRMAFDGTAIFCPDTHRCYYIRNDELHAGDTLTLRIDDCKWNRHRCRMAVQYTDPNRLFALVAQPDRARVF